MKTNKRGIKLLQDPSLNKSTAFTEAEKQALGLVGLFTGHRTRLPDPSAKVQIFHLHAPGSRLLGTPGSRACWNSPKPVTSRCAGPAGQEFATLASAG